jgi:hypothetical protein
MLSHELAKTLMDDLNRDLRNRTQAQIARRAARAERIARRADRQGRFARFAAARRTRTATV